MAAFYSSTLPHLLAAACLHFVSYIAAKNHSGLNLSQRLV